MVVIMPGELDRTNSLFPVLRGEGWGEGSAARSSEEPVTRLRVLRVSAFLPPRAANPSPPPSPRKHPRGEGVCVIVLFALLFVSTVARAAAPTSKPTSKESTQQFCLRETDPNSPRKSKLKSSKPDPNEIVRIDVDGDGDPDILETWWNGHRVRWIDENDDMKWTDVRGDMTADSLQIDRDGDGYYDGPGDLNIKWCDDDGDGRPDLQMFAANPTLNQKTTHGGTSVWMIYLDLDHD